MRGSLNISFNNGCLSIRYHLFIKIGFSNLAQKGGIILFIEIRFPQHYRGYLKKSRFTKGGHEKKRKI